MVYFICWDTFLKNINSCLDRVFSIENTFKEIGLYYPISNEISPLVFIKYFKDNTHYLVSALNSPLKMNP